MTKIVFEKIDIPHIDQLETYLAHGGFEAFQKTLQEKKPEALVEAVKQSGIRGRGGAGFPAGMKWGFIPRTPGLKYVVCNGDEGEPGTFKDREIIERIPHLLLEGVLLAAYAVGAEKSVIYLRYEFTKGYRQLKRALEEIQAKGFVGKNILGSGFDHELVLFRGAGAYICGEETAMLESIEGNRPNPRSKPPFPAIAGLFGTPTLINNVETLCNIPAIALKGAEWFKSIGVEGSRGTKIFSLSGHVKRPGNYELPLGTPLRTLIEEYGQGVPGGRKVKAVLPGGSSSAYLTQAHLDIPLDFNTLAKAGTMLGSGAVIVLDETTCMVEATERLAQFYRHESCGKCTPCREGLDWITKIYQKMRRGEATRQDIDLINNVAGFISGKALCALADGAINPILSSIQYFREEYEAHIQNGGRCPGHRPVQEGAVHA